MTVATRIVDGLREIVETGRVLVDNGLERYRLGGAKPAAAVFPADESEVSRVLRLAWEVGLGVIPWGGGVHQAVGRLPERYGLALDLGAMNRVLEYEPADMTATAQGGIRMTDLQKCLGAHGQFLPLDPPLAEQASLGGIIATNLSGPLRCRYGNARDLILGMRVVHADGTVTKAGAKVVKNASAYDMTKLYVGSLGTLGVILEATVRVYPRPAAEQGWWIPVAEWESAQAVTTRILGSHLIPNRVELLDAAGAEACGRTEQGITLVISFAAVPEALQAQAADLARIAEECGTAPTRVLASDRTWTALSNFPWVHAGGDGAGLRAIWRGSVLPAECAKGMRAVGEATTGMAEVAMAASVAHGILRGTFRAESPDAIGQSLRAARDALSALGGLLVVLDAPASVLHTTDIWGPPPDGLAVMHRLKRSFDAKEILNPGRFVGGI